MEVKLIEIRDRNTFLPALAVSLDITTDPEHWVTGHEALAREEARMERERYLLRRCGYSRERIEPGTSEPYVVLTPLRADGSPCRYDEYGWGDRTYQITHQWLLNNWSTVCSGDVVDVEFILGEAQEPKQSEQITVGDCV